MKKIIIIFLLLTSFEGVMAQPFNTTNWTNTVDLFEYANTVTSPSGLNYFGDLVVVAIWVVVWGVFSNILSERPQIKALIVSSFTAFFFAVMLDLVSLVDRLMVALPFAGLLISIVADKILEG